jgi:UDP-N-acetylglucosamine--N-acetylmuramyl-(pentapeptide) pyrophosphoryl-undecaprenol N-acetylglucosamine transferase
VPFPFAAEDHQTANAKFLADRDAAIMVKDSEAKDQLVAQVIALAKDIKKQDELKANISKYAVSNADEQVAVEILKSI